MVDTQVLRRKIAENCIHELEAKTSKVRMTPEEIQDVISSIVTKVVKEDV